MTLSHRRSQTLRVAAGLCTVVCLLLASHSAHAEKKDIKLIINNPKNAKAPQDACKAEVCASLLELINGAKTSIDFAIYGMRDQSAIMKALVSARKRGVEVRGVIDRDADGNNYYTSTEELVRQLGGKSRVHSDIIVEQEMLQEARDKAFDRKMKGGQALEAKEKCVRPEGFRGPLQCLGYDLGEKCLVASHASREDIETAGAIMHHKFMVVDKKVVWMGSTNISDSGTGGYNANLVLVVRSTKIAGWYTREFETMFVEGRYHNIKSSQGRMWESFGGGVKAQVMFSPQDKPVTKGVRPLLQAATKSIDVSIFFLTHKGIAKDLIKAHQRGVKVRVILDATAARNGYTKHELLRAAGVPVKVESWGGKMHMKSAVIDSKIVIAGSMNWTSAGEGGNDENTIILYSKKHAERFAWAYDNLWDSIPDKWLEGRPDPESFDSGSSCKDGVDNDFDKLADKRDPGCGRRPPKLPALPPWKIVSKESGHGLIKGTGHTPRDYRYYTPANPRYDDVFADKWFCSELDASEAGYRGR